METKFTPGPWAVGKDGAFGPNGSGVGVIVAACPNLKVDANAHLIAAAPELYEALAMLEMFFAKSGASRVRQWERVPAAIQAEFITAALSALAKARGETR